MVRYLDIGHQKRGVLNWLIIYHGLGRIGGPVRSVTLLGEWAEAVSEGNYTVVKYSRINKRMLIALKRAQVLLTFFILIFSVSIGSAALAGPGKWDEHAVPVPLERDNGVYCTLDAATIRSTACLNATTFVDVWVKYKLDEKAWQRLEMMHDGELSGDELKNVRIIKVRYLFRLENAVSGKVPLKFELERRYEGADGQLIRSDGFRVPDAKSKWYTLDTTEQKVLLRLLTEPNFYHSVPMDIGLNEYMLQYS